jgi:outer membrane receptor for ferrienterochelin and colicins
MLTKISRFPFSLIFTTTILLCLSLVPLDARGELPSEFKDFEEVSLESFTDMVIVTASKHEQRLSEAPAFVTVITSEMIEDYGFETVAEALQVVPGLYVNYDRNIYCLGVRGVGLMGDRNSRVQLLLNDHVLNEQSMGRSNIGELVGVNIGDIERIEVVRGPSSSLYGSCAFLATINIITKEAQKEGEFDLTGRYTHQTENKDVELSFSKAFESGAEVFLSSSIQDMKGARLFFPEYSHFDLSMLVPDENGAHQYFLSVEDFTGGYTSGTDFKRSRHLFGQLKWKDWTLQGRLAAVKKGTPSGFFGSLFNNRNNYFKENGNFVELKFHRSLKRNLDFMTRVHYDDSHLLAQVALNYYSMLPDPPYLPGPVSRLFGVDDCWGGETRFDWEVVPWERLTFGVVYQSHQIYQHSGELDSTLTYIVNERGPENTRHIHFDVWNIYFQNELKFGKHLSLVGAGSYSERDHSKAFFAPKMGLVLSHEDLGVMKAIYAQAFRAPSIYELTFDNQFSHIGNPALVQEKVNTGELIYERFLRGGVRVSVCGYEGIAENLISAREIHAGDPEHPGAPYLDIVNQYYNLDKIEFRGLEFGLEKQTRDGYSGFLNFGIQSVKDKKTKQKPPNSPGFLANFGFSAPLWKNIVRGSLLGRFVDERKAYDGQTAKSYFTCDLWLHLNNTFTGLSISAGVKNLFDSDIIDPVFEEFYPVVLLKHEGREVVINVNYSLGI